MNKMREENLDDIVYDGFKTILREAKKSTFEELGKICCILVLKKLMNGFT